MAAGNTGSHARVFLPVARAALDPDLLVPLQRERGVIPNDDNPFITESSGRLEKGRTMPRDDLTLLAYAHNMTLMTDPDEVLSRRVP